MPYIYGQLLNAQLENSVGAPSSGGTPTGRIYVDTTVPAQVSPKIYNGSAWVPLLVGQTSSLITQTSTAGSTVTVNWANGLYQEVILGGHTTIQFSNPQPGSVHTLLVTQRPTETSATTPWMYNFIFPDQYPRRLPYQQKGAINSSESHVYSWFYSSAVKPAYATVPTNGNMLSVSGTAAVGLVMNPRTNTFFSGQTGTPYYLSIQVVDAGTKLRPDFVGTVPIGTSAVFAAALTCLDVTPEGDALFVGSGTTPYLQGISLDPLGFPSTMSGAIWVNPATLPAGAVQCLAVHPSGSHVVVGHTTTPFMSCYPIFPTSSKAYGTKLANPTTVPAAQVNAVAWSPTGDFLAVASQTSPYIQVYSFDPFTGLSSAPITQPATLPVGGPPGAIGKAIAWHPSGNYIAMGMNASPWIYIVAFNRVSGAFGASSTVTLVGGPAATVSSLQFTPDGNYLVVGNNANAFVFDTSALPTFNGTALTWDNGGLGFGINDICVHPNGEYVGLSIPTAPYFYFTYLPRKAKNYMRMSV